jgi:serine/threonine protein kinase/WD40 repeat protein
MGLGHTLALKMRQDDVLVSRSISMNAPEMREEWIIRQARQRPAAERAAFLDGACAGDLALRERLERLPAAPDQPEEVLADGIDAATMKVTIKLDFADESADEAVGQVIGHYKLLQKIGEGGCGAVYMADQEQPVHRRVAVKVIKLGMDTKAVIARFEAERQALALMDHPNIAKVLDAGSTEAGRPYFVMELVRGIKITEYCDQNKLATRERLELFIKICQAIQHAHQKGIIHRDIKPSNILVTMHDGVPVPKVIDFGIAKTTTDQRLTDKTLFTAYEQFIGTPAYMSPEQAEMSGLDIDTRSDIYSLGVLLYELLTGRTPFDPKELMESGLDAMRKTIREKEPVRPSTKVATLQGEELTTTAERHAAEGPKLISLLRGDLDWIVMKCLEKDRTRRYETANGLAFDLKRHLTNEPVLARPPSAAYRFQKALRRNKLAFAAGAAISAALLLGIMVSTWEAIKAGKAKREQSSLRAKADNALAGEERGRALAEQRLYDSLLGEARATRIARRVGYRAEVFNLLHRARALQSTEKDLATLRYEAVLCLGDFVGLTPTTFDDFQTNIVRFRLSPTGKLAAFGLGSGEILLRQMPTGLEIARWAGRGSLNDLCFSMSGDHLISTYQGLPDTNQPSKLARGATSEVRVWASEENGHWHEEKIIPLPGAFNCLASSNGLYVDTLDWDARVGRLINLETRAVVQTFAFQNRENFWWPAVGLSPDGRFLATETLSGTDSHSVVLDIWDLIAGKKEVTLPGQRPLYIQGLNFSPDGKYLACVSDFGCVIYQVKGFQPAGSFAGICFQGHSRVSFGSDDTVLAFADPVQQGVRLWDRVRSQDFAVLRQPGSMDNAEWAQDASFLLTAGHQQARLYRTDLAEEKLRLSGHAGSVFAIAFNPDGTRIASVGEDRALRVWEARTGQKVWEANGLGGAGQCVGFSPDGRWVVHGYEDISPVGIWDARAGKKLGEFGNNGRVVSEDNGTFSLAFNENGNLLIRSRKDGIEIWSLERDSKHEGEDILQEKLIKSLSGTNCYGLVLSPDRRQIAFVEYDGDRDSTGVYVRELEGNAAPRRLSRWSFRSLSLWSQRLSQSQPLSFTPDSLQLLMINRERELLTLDIATGKQVSSFPTIDPKQKEWSFPNLTLGPDGSKLALSSPSGLGVDIWDPRGRRLLYSLPEQPGIVLWLAWSPDGQRLGIARSNGDISIWGLREVERILAQQNLSP